MAGFEAKVAETVRQYRLASKKDRVAVACSGGKDSTVALHILDRLGLGVFALHMDLGIGEWSRRNRRNLEGYCSEREIPLHVIDAKEEFGEPMPELRSVAALRSGLRNCAVCGVIRRWALNRKAKELGATRLATGHNLDDEAQTVLMNLFRGTPEFGAGKGPKSKGGMFVTKIKPLYFCAERDVEAYSRKKGFPVVYRPCPCSKDASRQDTKEWLRKMEKRHPGSLRNIAESFLEASKSMERKGEARSCKACGEPCRGETCRACSFISMRKD